MKPEKSKCPKCRHNVVTWTFHLPDEKYDVQSHMKANDMRSILWDLDQDMRSKIKYGDELSEETKTILADYRSLINELNLEE